MSTRSLFKRIVRGLSALVVLCLPGSRDALTGDTLSALEFRQVVEGKRAETGTPIPRDAVRVFAYEGETKSVGVNEDSIAVDYGLTGCLFDRRTGELTQRFTVADGWPKTRPEEFPPPFEEPTRLVGPGIAETRRPITERATSEVAARIEYRGETWRALQPNSFLRNVGGDMGVSDRREKLNGWTPILVRLNLKSSVERGGAAPEEGRTYTTQDGLASNIVTKFAAADGKLWAACVDIYDYANQAWGPGGLCWFDEKKDRWARLDRIEGHPVRFVSLLESIGDELWVGFREGSGVEGDTIIYGMGIYVGDYRPKTMAIVIARLKDGEWTVFSRPPRQDPPVSGFRGPEQQPPTEKPVQVVASSDMVILYSHIRSVKRSYGYDLNHDGRVSIYDLTTSKWRVFDPDEDFDADRLLELIIEEAEILVISNRGVHQWLPGERRWRFLDPACDLKNPTIAAVEPVGDELWIGYGKQAWGVYGRQGVSRFDEKTGTCIWTTPDEIGTACPMRRMVTLPGGEVWALFREPPYCGSAAEETPFYDREKEVARPPGVARFANGTWEFAAPMAGVPATREFEFKDQSGKIHTSVQLLPVLELIAVRESVFVANMVGIYMGPEPWKEIVALPFSTEGIWSFSEVKIEAAPDGETVLLAYEHPRQHQQPRKLTRARFRPGESDIRFETVEGDSVARLTGMRNPFFEERYDGFADRWARVGVQREGEWVVGPLPNLPYRSMRVIETPHAVWIAMPGQLIHLDRQKLLDWFGGPDAGN
jgi:hypothetical protein